MGSAAITIIENPATIESDTNAAVITKIAATAPFNFAPMAGVLVNGGAVKTFIAITCHGNTGGTLATTDAQAQLVVGLPAGASIPWLPHYASIQHKTASSSTVLYWFPNGPANGMQR